MPADYPSCRQTTHRAGNLPIVPAEKFRQITYMSTLQLDIGMVPVRAEECRNDLH